MFARTTLLALGASALLAFAACGSEGIPPADGREAPAAAPTPAPTAPPPPTPEADAGPAPGDGAVRFIAIGDTGTGTDAQQRVANAMAAKCAKDGCDFVQLLGDNIYESGVTSTSDALWQTHFETPYAVVNVPFWAVLGNHDYGAKGAGLEFTKGQFEVDYTQVSTKWKMPAKHYRHTKGPVELFALDTNMILFGQADPQKTDMQAWLAASTAPWKIVVGHHPYLSNGKHGNAGDYDNLGFLGETTLGQMSGFRVRDFMEDVVCGKADVYLAGHDHSKQWLDATCQGTELAVSGAGAKFTEITARNPSLFQSLTIGFLYLVVTDRKLTAEFIDENGVVEFTHTIDK